MCCITYVSMMLTGKNFCQISRQTRKNFSGIASILKALQEQSSAAACLAQKQRAAVHPSLQWLAVKRHTSVVERTVCETLAKDSLEWLRLHSGACRRAKFGAKTIHGSRAEKEQQELLRWQQKLSNILVDARVPALAEFDTESARQQRLDGRV